jgi:hypothetical protein
MSRLHAARRLLIAAAVVIAPLTTAALAWGPTGHSEVGGIADELLKQHPHAAARVHEILGDITLQQAGPWGDCIRAVSGPDGGFHYTHSPIYGAPCVSFETPERTAQMEDYVRRNWSNCSYHGNDGCHTQYHFLDVAIQRPGYRDGLVGTRDYDIVHAIKAAIIVLRGGQSPAPFSFTQRDALMMLVHFVGDIHQPLHVGSIYLDENGNVVDPDSSAAERARAETTTITNGGNSLVWQEGSRTMNLHSIWDGVTPGDYSVAGARQVRATRGPAAGWAAQWATDSLVQSRAVLAGLSYAPRQGRRWPIAFADRAGYDAARQAMQRRQIDKAGARLAQLLVAIWPDRRAR